MKEGKQSLIFLSRKLLDNFRVEFLPAWEINVIDSSSRLSFSSHLTGLIHCLLKMVLAIISLSAPMLSSFMKSVTPRGGSELSQGITNVINVSHVAPTSSLSNRPGGRVGQRSFAPPSIYMIPRQRSNHQRNHRPRSTVVLVDLRHDHDREPQHSERMNWRSKWTPAVRAEAPEAAAISGPRRSFFSGPPSLHRQRSRLRPHGAPMQGCSSSMPHANLVLRYHALPTDIRP